MSRHRIASILVAVQAIVLPIVAGSLGGTDRIFVGFVQILLAVLCVGIFAHKEWALWTAFVLMAVQVPVIEAEILTWRVTAGSALSVGVLKESSWLDSRIGLNYFAGYVFNGAILHAPLKRLLTDGATVTGAFMANFAVVPALVLLWPTRKSRKEKRANKAPEPTPGSVMPPAEPGVTPAPRVAHL